MNNPELTAVICVIAGGEMFTIQVDGKRYVFEMHPYCGPNILNHKGEPLKHQPIPFLEAASLWAQQGERVSDNGLCVWEREPEPILKHLGGNNYEISGYKPARKGK